MTELLYTADHEWIRLEGGTATVGITDYAAQQLGDVVFVELPAVGTAVTAGQQIGEIESTKSVGELFAPVDGTVVAVNEAVVDGPELVNAEPFAGGWLVSIEVSGSTDALLSEADYRAGLS
jgi:glycine cleavage system H protein